MFQLSGPYRRVQWPAILGNLAFQVRLLAMLPSIFLAGSRHAAMLEYS